MTAVPVTRTWVAGEVVTDTHFNTNIRDVLLYLLSPPILEIYQTTLQSVNNGTYTAYTFTTESADSSGMHSTSVNTSRATAVYPGWYDWGGATVFVANATGGRGAVPAVNGTQMQAGDSFAGTAGGALNHMQPTRSKLMFLNVGDYAEILGYQNSGGALNSLSGGTGAANMSMKWVSN